MNEKIKILYLTDKVTFGGTPLQMIELISHLQPDEFSARLVALSAVHAALRKRVLAMRMPVEEIGCGNWTQPAALPAVVRLFRTIKAMRPHIVHAYLTTGNVLGAVLGKCAGVPWVITSHRDLGGFDGKWITIANRWTDRFFADVVTVNSFAVKQAVLERAKLANKRFEVLYNGIDSAKITDAHTARKRRPKLGLQPQDFAIAVVANFRPAKGQDIAVRAFARMSEKQPQAFLLFFGAETDRQYAEKVREIVRRHGLAQRVKFMGVCEHVPRWLGAVDVLLAPSLTEGFSNTILEAMAAGVVVIASAVGGTVEQIVDGETGYLVPPADADALAEKVQTVLECSEKRLAMGKAARQSVCEKFSLEKTVAAHERLYRSLMRSTSITA